MPSVEGIVDNIVFQNEENGYVVAHISQGNDRVTIVGCIPFIMEGQSLKLEGSWVTHPQFGQQLKVEKCEENVPSSIIGIEKYLSSGAISGIGPVTAKKIVKKFGEKSLDILENEIHRLKEIEGIGDKKIDVIFESYSKQREVKNIMVFLQTYGVSPNQCVKIHRKYGTESIEKVKKNPYDLTEDITGIGFKTADKIARSLGIEINSPYRIQSGIKYVINQFCAVGNTYMPLDKLIDEGKSILTVSEEDIQNNIYQCAFEQKIKIETVSGTDCVFTMPYYYYELGVTKKILTLAFTKYDKVNEKIDEDVEKFEEEHNIKFAGSQKEAIEGAFENGIEVITGGPGTGKTTIIKCIIELFENIGMSVLMAAPTGRAAKRMTEATGRESKTIHRLLELGYSDDDNMKFQRSEESPLQCNVLIVDEASMIDIMLMNSLLKAVSIGTRLIIVGDVDQLPSVGPGNVLRDIIESKCVKVVRLKEIFRQAEESMIVVNAHKINSGQMPILNEKGKDFFFIKSDIPEEILNTVIELVDKRLPKFNANWDKLKNIQILSPMRKGILGIENLNIKLQNILNPKSDTKKEKTYKDTIFRVGDKVMQTKNNYNLKWKRVSLKSFGENEFKGRDTSQNNIVESEGIGVFNGDIGFISEIDDENNTLSVIFDEEREIVYDNIYLDELDLAYAMTIHKSQGSEFPVVILPMYIGPPMLMNKNLLYTGITRAKQLVVMVGSIKAVNFMVSNNRSFERYSLLKWRISNVLENEI